MLIPTKTTYSCRSPRDQKQSHRVSSFHGPCCAMPLPVVRPLWWMRHDAMQNCDNLERFCFSLLTLIGTMILVNLSVPYPRRLSMIARHRNNRFWRGFHHRPTNQNLYRTRQTSNRKSSLFWYLNNAVKPEMPMKKLDIRFMKMRRLVTEKFWSMHLCIPSRPCYRKHTGCRPYYMTNGFQNSDRPNRKCTFLRVWHR